LKIISIGTTGMGALAFIIFSIYWRKHISIKSEKKFSNNDI